MDDMRTAGGDKTVGDSWSNWDPDPERAFREHDPAREPFASMSRAEILERMRHAKGGREWEFLREFLLDHCTEEERNSDTFLAILKTSMGLDHEEFCLFSEVAGLATRVRPGSARCPPARESLSEDVASLAHAPTLAL
jgi:hypothetical protein